MCAMDHSSHLWTAQQQVNKDFLTKVGPKFLHVSVFYMQNALSLFDVTLVANAERRSDF
jgi:hypothetical protein